MLICWTTRYNRGMTNESVTTKKAHAKGYPARLVGGILLVLGILISAGVGQVTVAAGFLIFGGLITLVVGLAQKNTA